MAKPKPTHGASSKLSTYLKKQAFTRPGQRDAQGRRIDAGKQPGGDPGDQARKPGTSVRGRQK